MNMLTISDVQSFQRGNLINNMNIFVWMKISVESDQLASAVFLLRGGSCQK